MERSQLLQTLKAELDDLAERHDREVLHLQRECHRMRVRAERAEERAADYRRRWKALGGRSEDDDHDRSSASRSPVVRRRRRRKKPVPADETVPLHRIQSDSSSGPTVSEVLRTERKASDADAAHRRRTGGGGSSSSRGPTVSEVLRTERKPADERRRRHRSTSESSGPTVSEVLRTERESRRRRRRSSSSSGPPLHRVLASEATVVDQRRPNPRRVSSSGSSSSSEAPPPAPARPDAHSSSERYFHFFPFFLLNCLFRVWKSKKINFSVVLYLRTVARRCSTWCRTTAQAAATIQTSAAPAPVRRSACFQKLTEAHRSSIWTRRRLLQVRRRRQPRCADSAASTRKWWCLPAPRRRLTRATARAAASIRPQQCRLLSKNRSERESGLNSELGARRNFAFHGLGRCVGANGGRNWGCGADREICFFR